MTQSDKDNPARGFTLATKRFVYISRPTEALTAAALQDLLFHARRNNALDGLHGLLTFDRRGFLQVLEGTAAAIDTMLARIGRDPRHCDMQLLLLDPAATPMFYSFVDLVPEGKALASLDMLHPRSVARLSPDIIRTIERGYVLLDK